MFLNFQNKVNVEQSLITHTFGSRILILTCVSAIFLLGVLTARVRAEEPKVIEELLQLDTQAALLSARQKVVGPLSFSGPAAALSTDNVLLAIYGVGQSLTAEVLLDAELHVFKHRRLQPILGRSIKYTLERIAPPCVHLNKLESREVLCLGQRLP
jgi:hypothetical protein